LKFDQFFQTLFAIESPYADPLFGFIQNLLYKYRLSNAYEVKDILIEVYSRGVKHIEKGESIEKLCAWSKKVALNVIREFYRAAEQVSYYDLDTVPYLASTSEDFLSQLDFESDIRLLHLSLDALPSQDRQIIWFQFFEGLSWKEISVRLAQQGEAEISENALRQRGHRALKRMRSIYQEKDESLTVIGELNKISPLKT